MGDSGGQNALAVEYPHSIAQASVDEKGRLKLPAEFLAFLEAMGVTKVFITTFDLRLARIYPMPVWESNEKLFAGAGVNAGAAERLAFLAKVYGGDAEIDKSGRVLLPAKLRERGPRMVDGSSTERPRGGSTFTDTRIPGSMMRWRLKPESWNTSCLPAARIGRRLNWPSGYWASGLRV